MPKRTTHRKTSVRRSHSGLSGTNLSPYAFGHALGLIGIIFLLVYGVLVWFAGYNETLVVQRFPLEFSFSSWTIILGLIEIYVLAYIFGWIFVRLYNKTLREA